MAFRKLLAECGVAARRSRPSRMVAWSTSTRRSAPADAVTAELVDSGTHTTCPWKGVASYKSVVVDGKTNADAAWFYPEPKDAAKEIKDRYAFWKGVTVTA